MLWNACCLQAASSARSDHPCLGLLTSRGGTLAVTSAVHVSTCWVSSCSSRHQAIVKTPTFTSGSKGAADPNHSTASGTLKAAALTRHAFDYLALHMQHKSMQPTPRRSSACAAKHEAVMLQVHNMHHQHNAHGYSSGPAYATTQSSQKWSQASSGGQRHAHLPEPCWIFDVHGTHPHALLRHCDDLAQCMALHYIDDSPSWGLWPHSAPQPPGWLQAAVRAQQATCLLQLSHSCPNCCPTTTTLRQHHRPASSTCTT
jgi:hypothetical protein